MIARALVVLATLGGLGTIATPAAAACAWILWGEVVSPGWWGRTLTEQVLLETYTLKQECEAPVTTRAVTAGFFDRATEAAEAKRGGLVRRRHCLPDTIDPRAPKGT